MRKLRLVLVVALVVAMSTSFVSAGLAVGAVPSKTTVQFGGMTFTVDATFLQRVRQSAHSVKVSPQELKQGFVVLGSSKVFSEMNKFRGRRDLALSLMAQQAEAAKGRMQAAQVGLVPFRSAAPAFSRNLLLSRDFGTPIQTEPYVCSDPEDRGKVVVAVSDYGFPYNSVYRSIDAGETWSGPHRVPLTNDTYFAGDPVVACSNGGKVSHVFMSLGDWDITLRGMPLNVGRSDIAVSKSGDSGLSWQTPSVVYTNTPRDAVVAVQNPKTGKPEPVQLVLVTFLDKPWISVGPDPKDPSKERVYVTFTRFSEIFMAFELDMLGPGFLGLFRLASLSQIVGAVSVDDGKTWTLRPVSEQRVSYDVTKESARLSESIYPLVQGSQPKVSKNGTAYIAWYDSTDDGFPKGKMEIHVASSRDGGATWSKPVVAATGLLEPQFQPQSSFFRNSGSRLPHLEVGKEGEVYIVVGGRVESRPTDDGDIYFIRGKDKDGTLTFDAPKRINTYDETDRLQFFPALTVDDNGAINVMWADTRDFPTGLQYHIYMTQSRDKGETWGFEDKVRGVKENDVRVTDFYSNPNKGFPRGEFIGDYFGIAPAAGDDAYLVWADTRLGEYGGINQKIGFARRQSMKSPEAVLSPARGPAGQEVTVQAHGFQPDMNVFVQMGGSITFVGRTNAEGYAERKVHIPQASEGAQTVVVFDESGNSGNTQFVIEKGVGSLSTTKDVQALSTEIGEGYKRTQRLVGALGLFVLLVGAVTVFWVGRKRKS